MRQFANVPHGCSFPQLVFILLEEFYFFALFLLDKGIFIVAFINFWMASGFSPKMLWFLFILHLNFSSIRNLS